MLMYFNRGRRVPPRRPDDVTVRHNWEFFAVLSGRAAPYFSARDKVKPIGASLWLLPPSSNYSWWSDQNGEVDRVVFHFVNIDLSLREMVEKRRFICVPLDEAGADRVRELADAAEGDYQAPTLASPLQFASVKAGLSLLVSRDLFAGQTSSLSIRRQLVARKALAYYERELPRRAKIDEVADASGVSASQLRRIFHQTFDTTPKHLFFTAQIERAKALAANSDLLSSEIAERSGFVSASHLGHIFRQRTGLTFFKWRTQLAGLERLPHVRAQAFTQALEPLVRAQNETI